MSQHKKKQNQLKFSGVIFDNPQIHHRVQQRLQRTPEEIEQAIFQAAQPLSSSQPKQRKLTKRRLISKLAKRLSTSNQEAQSYVIALYEIFYEELKDQPDLQLEGIGTIHLI